MSRIATPFGFHATATEVLDGIDLTGRRAVVTGGASGIGIETVRALAGAGADVTIASRNTRAGVAAAADVTGSTGNPAVSVSALDLADLRSVAAFVDGWTGPLDILVDNAGIMANPTRELSPQGHELQLATNYLGHFALAVGLHPALAAADDGARIVIVSSNAHWLSPVVLDDLDFERRAYEPLAAYGQSKTADILLAVEATRRWAADGIVANALNPGAIASDLQRHLGGMRTPVDRRKTPEQGAATSALLAASPLLDGIGGRYFDDAQEAEMRETPPELFEGGIVAPFAVDPVIAEQLWDVSLELVR